MILSKIMFKTVYANLKKIDIIITKENG